MKSLRKKLQKQSFQLGLLIIVTSFVYLPLFWNGFVIDDTAFITKWQQGQSFNIVSFFQGALPQGQEGVYRPIRSILYSIYWHLFGNNPFGYHLHGLVVQVVCTVLLFVIFKNITKKQFMAFFGALLFGLHPIHTESISYIASSMDMTAVVFFLLAYYFYLQAFVSKKIHRISYVTSVFCAFLAFFTNETTLVLPLLLVLSDIFLAPEKFITKKRKQTILLYFPYFFGVFFFLFIRFFLLHIGGRASYFANNILLTGLLMIRVVALYVQLLLVPIGLVNNHMVFPHIEAFVYRGYNSNVTFGYILSQPLFWMSLVIIGLVFGFFWYCLRWNRLVSFGIGWFFISLLPALDIVPQGSLMNERLLYIPSIGFVIASMGVFALFYQHKKKVISIIFICLVSLYGIATFVRNLDWHDEITLWSKDVSLSPKENAYAYFQLGNAYKEQGDLEKALVNYQKAFVINPHFAVSEGSAAQIYQSLGEDGKAEVLYKKGLAADPSLWEAYVNLANLYVKEDRIDGASQMDIDALQFQPQLPRVKQQLQTILQLMQQRKIDNANLQSIATTDYVMQYPNDWTVVTDGQMKISNKDKSFMVSLYTVKLLPDQTLDEIVTHASSYGFLVVIGNAFIPTADNAIVRQFIQHGTPVIQFFLLHKNSVLEIVAKPSDGKDFLFIDGMLNSLQWKN